MLLREALNLMLVRQNFDLPIVLPISHNKRIITENKKFRNSKTRWFWNRKLEMRFVQNILGTYLEFLARIFSIHFRIVLHTNFKIELNIRRNTYVFLRFRTLCCAAILKLLGNPVWKKTVLKSTSFPFSSVYSTQKLRNFSVLK